MKRLVPLLMLAGCSQGEAPKPAPGDAVVSISLPADTVTLPTSAAGEVVTVACTACHSAEMILQQPPMDAAKWQATVTKMREVYKAQIAPDEDKALVRALVSLQAK